MATGKHRSPALDWPLRSPDSAQTGWRVARNGQLRISIAHAPLRGVTPAMLVWWFGHIHGTMTVGGEQLSRYRVWHARDHIAHEVARHAAGGIVGPGARFHIVETIGGRHVDTVVRVEQLDASGIALTRKVLGCQIFRIAHEFHSLEVATRLVTRIQVGLTVPPHLAAISRLGRALAFPDRVARALRQHSIEEVGNLEHFLPALYATEGPR